MKKFIVIVLAVILVGIGATWAISNPEPPRPPDPDAMENVFALAGGGYRLGVVLSDISPHLRDDLKIESGVLVDEVVPDSAAEKGGMKAGDIILKLDGKVVESDRDVRKALRDVETEKQMSVEVLRDGKVLNLQVTPAKNELKIINRMVGGPYIGVELQELDSDLSKYFQTQPGAGILVTRVEPQTPASKGGLKSGDVITDWNGKKISTQKDLRKGMDEMEDGQEATVGILRNGKAMKLTIKPEQRNFKHFEHLGNLPEIPELKELRDLPKSYEFRELRDLPNSPEFRESMRNLKQELQSLKEQMEVLRRDLEDLRDSD